MLPLCKPEERLRQGPYESKLIMETFAAHFSTFGINMDPWLVENSAHPIGALVLAIAAVS
jgi:hypothetical protein